MSARRNIPSGTKWEAMVGYSRAVRHGAHVWVSGTTAVDDTGAVVGAGDAYAEAAFILQKIGRALAVAGASFTDVVRTRMYIVNLADGEAAGRAHGEIFSAIRPAATLIAVQALVEPELLVEIEAEAYLSTRE